MNDAMPLLGLEADFGWEDSRDVHALEEYQAGFTGSVHGNNGVALAFKKELGFTRLVLTIFRYACAWKTSFRVRIHKNATSGVDYHPICLGREEAIETRSSYKKGQNPSQPQITKIP